MKRLLAALLLSTLFASNVFLTICVRHFDSLLFKHL